VLTKCATEEPVVNEAAGKPLPYVIEAKGPDLTTQVSHHCCIKKTFIEAIRKGRARSPGHWRGQRCKREVLRNGAVIRGLKNLLPGKGFEHVNAFTDDSIGIISSGQKHYPLFLE